MMSAAARVAAATAATLAVRDVSHGLRTFRCRYDQAQPLRRGHLPLRRPCMVMGQRHVPWSNPWHFTEGRVLELHAPSVLASGSLYPSSLFTLHSLLFARPSVESATATSFHAACAQHGGWRRALELLGDSGSGEQFNLLLDTLWRDGERLTACDQLLRACVVGAFHPQLLWTGGHLERLHLTGLSTGAALAAVAVWLAKIETLVVGDGIRRDPFLLPTEFVITLDDPMEDDLSVAGGSTTSQLLARQAGDGVVAWLSAHDSPFKPFDEDHLVATQAAVSDWLLGLQRTLPGQPPRSAFITLVAAATPPARPPLKRGPPFAKP